MTKQSDKTNVQSKVDHMVFMKEAIAEARKGEKAGGVPIGSVLVSDGKIVGRGHNRRVQDGSPIMHAEINCLHNAGRIGKYHNTIIYSTLMPCAMCAGAIAQFRIPIVVAGENRTFESSADFLESKGVEVIDLNLDECFQMLADFARKHPDIWNEDIGEL